MMAGKGRERTKVAPEDGIPERRATSGGQGMVRRKSSLFDVLKKQHAVFALRDQDKKRRMDVLIVVLDGLSESEREVLLGMSAVVMEIHDDLIEKIAELKKENRQLRSLTLTDGLTGLYNTRFFVMQLEMEMARTKRTGQPSSLLMLDLDNFKFLNDTLGHVQGNRYLVKVAHVIRDSLRPTDIVCRYGGDEFAVIMPATDLYDAVHTANRLREAIPAVHLKNGLYMTASIGVAEYAASSSAGPEEFVHISDMALYKAKKGGKNKVFYEGQMEKPVHIDYVTPEEKESLSEEKEKE